VKVITLSLPSLVVVILLLLGGLGVIALWQLCRRTRGPLTGQDTLTGLHSRSGFLAALARQIEAPGEAPSGMVVALDINGQRNVNSALGHSVGDQLLTQVGQRLQQCTGAKGLVGRIGGDEFAVFLPAPSNRRAENLRRSLAATFDHPFYIDGIEVDSSARFGYTLGGDRPCSAESLLNEAELALLETRLSSPGTWTLFTRKLHREVRRRVELTHELHQALDARQLQLHYQPKVTLTRGEPIGCEALLRWHHPRRGQVPPGLFIPIAEQSLLICTLGDWVLHEACRHLRTWQDSGLPPVRVSLNVSVTQLRLGDFASRVQQAIAAYGVDPATLTFEITESVFAQEPDRLRQQLNELHRLGVRLSLDDFGTGYSSLRYLQQFPFDEIKVDKGFVQRIERDAYSRMIVAAVLAITEALKAEAVAEGVESLTMRDMLADMGCQVGQGNFFSKPLEQAAFRALLESGARLPLAGAPSPGGS
jgi:diguanylate cyclase (GGDEF)-like protein